MKIFQKSTKKIKASIEAANTTIAEITNNGQVTKNLWLTQAEYDEILEKDENTQYNILEDEV